MLPWWSAPRDDEHQLHCTTPLVAEGGRRGCSLLPSRRRRNGGGGAGARGQRRRAVLMEVKDQGVEGVGVGGKELVGEMEEAWPMRGSSGGGDRSRQRRSGRRRATRLGLAAAPRSRAEQLIGGSESEEGVEAE